MSVSVYSVCVCLCLFFSLLILGPTYIALHKAHTQTQSRPPDSCKNNRPDPGKLSLCAWAPTSVDHSPAPAPRKALQQRSTCAQARHLYFFCLWLTLTIKWHTKGRDITASLKWAFRKEHCLNWDASGVFIFTESLSPADGKNYCSQSLRRPASPERWAGQAIPSPDLISLRKYKTVEMLDTKSINRTHRTKPHMRIRILIQLQRKLTLSCKEYV